MRLEVEFPPELVELVAQRAADLVRADMPATTESKYLSIPEAAEFLRCKRQRIYDLCSAGVLHRFKDGDRVLILRADLEAYVGGVAHPLPRGSRGRTAAGVRA